MSTKEKIISSKHIVRMIKTVAAEEPDPKKKELQSDPSQLSALDLSDIGADGLSRDAFKGFTQLRRLNLSCNSIKQVGDTFEDFVPPLTWLKLSSNLLTKSGVEGVAPLSMLTTLSLSHNKIDSIPRKALRGMKTLKALVLDHNEITKVKLPSSLKSLTTLILSHNQIAELADDELEKLPLLTKLSISGNELTKFPSFERNTKIAEIKMAHNQIAEVPSGSFAENGLSNLRVLDLSSNNIEDWDKLTAGTTGASQLLSISVRNNPVAKHAVDGDSSEKAKEMDGAYASKVLELFPSVKLIDFKKLSSYEMPTSTSFQETWKRKELRRKKNLISTRLQQPDKSKPRNKPCHCGSGIKYKLCCEKKDLVAPKDSSKEVEKKTEKDVATKQKKISKKEAGRRKTGKEEGSELNPAKGLAKEIALGSAGKEDKKGSKRKLEETEHSIEENEMKKKKIADSKEKLLETLAKSDSLRGSGVVNVVENKRRKRNKTEVKSSNRVTVADGKELAELLNAAKPTISAWD